MWLKDIAFVKDSVNVWTLMIMIILNYNVKSEKLCKTLHKIFSCEIMKYIYF